jgi:hypothetical protein
MSQTRRHLILPMAILAILTTATHVQAETARGRVFNDANGNGRYDAGESGLGAVGVSNGTEVVTTDPEGNYTLEIGEEGFVFVIKPAHWQIPLDPKTKLPRHFYAHRPKGSPNAKYPGIAPTGPLPERIDFALTPQQERGPFEVVCFGDTQPRNQQEVDFISHDVLEELIDVDAAFGLTLGDLVFNNLDMLPQIAQSVATLGLPWHHVIGNHDINFDTPDYAHAAETYGRVFGPPYYSFNHGKVHFLVLNDIFWEVENRRYHGELGAAQRAFIAADLALVPKDHLIVPLMHIPLQDLVDRDKLFELLKPFPNTFSIAAHWHRQEHFFLDEAAAWKGTGEHHHLVQGTACGAWWTGGYDELGIPHTTMSDGTPNGYAIITFSGTDYSVRYKAARRPDNYQMNIAAPEAISTAATGTTEIVANIFGGSERSSARFRVRDFGEWQEMTQFTGLDPYVEATSARESALAAEFAKLDGITEPNPDELKRSFNKRAAIVGRSTPGPRETGHLWKGNLPANMPEGYHVIEVETTDMFGQVFAGRRIIRVLPVP